MQDNEAKYGTLVLVQTQRLNIIDNVELNLQIGRSFINCKNKTPFRLFKCCDNSKEIINYNSYFKQNSKKIGMKKILTVKTEIDEEEKEKENEKEFILENKENIDNNINFQQTPEKKEEPVMEIDIGVDEDENANKYNINISKYTFTSNENSKNLLLNSMTLRRIDIISPLKDSYFKRKGISRNYELSALNNSTGLIPITHRTGKISLINK